MELIVMATLANTQAAAVAPHAARFRLRAALVWLLTTWRASRQYHRDLAELRGTSNRDLRDLRINRCDIEAICKSAA